MSNRLFVTNLCIWWIVASPDHRESNPFLVTALVMAMAIIQERLKLSFLRASNKVTTLHNIPKMSCTIDS